MDISKYLDKTIDCSCGKQHRLEIKDIIVCENALRQVPDIVKKQGFQKPYLVCDCHTYQIAGEKIEQYLQKEGIPFQTFIFSDEALVPDEYAVGRLFTHLDISCDLIIGIGSGTINDICRFVSYKLSKKYFIVGTAPSMDGFASNVTPLIVNDMKITYEAQMPAAIIGDLDILKNAPFPMIAAGVADVLGKYVCLMDWKSAALFFDEYYCPYVVEMVKQSIQDMIEQADNIQKRNPQTIKKVMEALIFSGIAMSYIGNSRPASGGEHQMSHYWEMQFLFEKKPALLHGTKVGITTVGALYMYKKIAEISPNFKDGADAALQFSYDTWEKNIKKAYGKAADEVLSLEKTVAKNAPQKVLSHLKAMEKNWEDYIEEIRELPDPSEIVDLLKKMEAPYSPAMVGVSELQVQNAVLYAKDLRNRFGFLQVLFDLQIGENFAAEVIEYYKSL